MKLIWEQQKKAFTCNPKLVRYHSMIIRFCISLAAKQHPRMTNCVILLCFPADGLFKIIGMLLNLMLVLILQ